MKTKQVQLVQINNAYGNKIYLPYSIGLLQAYSQTSKLIKKKYEFKSFLYKREPVNDIYAKIGGVDILAISCYLWNTNLSLAVAKKVKTENPDCTVIIGGPNAPNDALEFMQNNPYVDVVCHGEGEKTFLELLETYLYTNDVSSVLGITYRDHGSNSIIDTPAREVINDVNLIPSVCLEGVFDDFIKNEPDNLIWMGIWETNRGCPFSCVFCDWGCNVPSKLRTFDMDRLKKEILWFAKNKISWVFGCDANFGILARDIELAGEMVRAKQSWGYPIEFRVCCTKNSDSRAFNAVKILSDEGMAKGASLSMQSLNPETLKNVKRSNIKLSIFKKLQHLYNKANIPTFTELIIALPGETYESFVDGINVILEQGQHSQLNIYNCSIIINSEMGKRKYQEKHGIKSITIPIFQPHSAPNEQDDIEEYDRIVVSTNTMPPEDWRRVQQFSWAVQCFHMLGLLQHIAIFMKIVCQIPYKCFYEELLSYFKKNRTSTIIGEEMDHLDTVLNNVLNGIGFNQYLPQFSNITWPPEEASFLRLSENKDRLFEEFRMFFNEFTKNYMIRLDNGLINNLFHYQFNIIMHYKDNGTKTIKLDYNLPEYIRGHKTGKSISLKYGDYTYDIIDHLSPNGDKNRFAHEVVWFGRKGGTYSHPVKRREVK